MWSADCDWLGVLDTIFSRSFEFRSCGVFSVVDASGTDKAPETGELYGRDTSRVAQNVMADNVGHLLNVSFVNTSI